MTSREGFTDYLWLMIGLTGLIAGVVLWVVL